MLVCSKEMSVGRGRGSGRGGGRKFLPVTSYSFGLAKVILLYLGHYDTLTL